MNVIPIEYFRAKGLTEELFTDDILLTTEELAWKFVETFCHQFFEKRTLTLVLDGSGEEELYLPYPIVSITDVSEEDEGAYTLSDLKIYNRRYPDDRAAPKIVYPDSPFPEGYQNISITGTFGYVDPDTGMPPSDLIDAVAKIVVLFLEPYVGDPEWSSSFDRHRLIQEQTDKWMYKFSTPLTIYGVTGVPEIDKVLFMYRRNDDSIYGGWV